MRDRSHSVIDGREGEVAGLDTRWHDRDERKKDLGYNKAIHRLSLPVYRPLSLFHATIPRGNNVYDRFTTRFSLLCHRDTLCYFLSVDSWTDSIRLREHGEPPKSLLSWETANRDRTGIDLEIKNSRANPSCSPSPRF